MFLNEFECCLQYNRRNSNSEGKRKTVRVCGGSSFQGRLKIQLARLIIDTVLLYTVYSTMQIRLISSEAGL